MRTEPLNSIAFTETRHAERLEELFAATSDKFEVYMDEQYHWDPERPANARQAGLFDARETPPKPAPDSKTPKDAEYISALYGHAQAFLEQRIGASRKKFNQLKKSVSGSLGSDDEWAWDRDRGPGKAEELRDAKVNRDREQRKCDEYLGANKDLIGNRIPDPTPRSPVVFVSLVIFVVVFEFVWVWYFLSGELGLTAAVNASMAAATVVVLISGLLAGSLAITKKDVDDKRMRAMGHSGIVACVLVFLFALGLLSAWRADSTSAGIGYIIDGYRSLVEIDVFVTALVNLAGVILLTHELGRFLWPFPLFHYGSRKKALAVTERLVKQKEEELIKDVKRRREDVSSKESELRERIEETVEYEGAESYLKTSAEDLNIKVAQNQRSYVESNKQLRTMDVYPEPQWFVDSAAGVDICTITELSKRIHSELRIAGDAEGETWKAEMERLLQERVNEAKKQIEAVQKEIVEQGPDAAPAGVERTL